MEFSNSPVKVHRNWEGLSRDVTLSILKYLDADEILESAQFVCRWWYILCKEEPSLWHTIRISSIIWHDRAEMRLYAAIHRSNGGLIELDIVGCFYSDKRLFRTISYKLTQLKRLRLKRCLNVLVSVRALKEALLKLPCLEELELTHWGFSERSIVHVISSCLRSLTTFRFNKLGSHNPYKACDAAALAIAGNMHRLRHLQLFGNNLTNVGLTAILDGCPCLQSLHLRACFQLVIRGKLGKRLSEQIKCLRHPHDSIADYGYVAIDEYSDDDDDDEINSRDVHLP